MEHVAPLLGLLGLIGLAGFAVLKHPVDKARPGGWMRHGGLLGLFGLAGFWIPGAGAAGAFGALGLWEHQNPRLALWGTLGLVGVVGLPLIALAALLAFLPPLDGWGRGWVGVGGTDPATSYPSTPNPSLYEGGALSTEVFECVDCGTR